MLPAVLRKWIGAGEAAPFELPDGERPEVHVRTNPRSRSVRLKIVPPGRVEVVVPPRFDARELPAILQRHRVWLGRTLARCRREWAAVRQPPTQLVLEAIDEVWQVDYVEGGTRALCREGHDGTLTVAGPDEAARRRALRRWLARQGKRYLVPWLEVVSAEVGLPYAGVAIRGQKSRWGSCSAKGNINLNFHLLFLPPAQVRYLMIHELCHTRHLNHSRRYWALVESKLPEYRALDTALRHAGERVPAWLRGE